VEKITNLYGFKIVYYLRSINVIFSNMDHNGTAANLTTSEGEGSSLVDGSDDMLWNVSEEGGDVSSKSGEDEEDTACEDGDSDTDW
jgi:hypothetical protein